MEDNKQFNNDGTPLESITPAEPTAAPHIPHGTQYHEAVPVPESRPPKKRRPWNKIALFLIILGLGIFAIGWATGARGASFVFEDGWFRIITTANDTFETVSIHAAVTEINVNSTSARIIVEPASNATSTTVTLSNINPDAVDFSGNTLSINTGTSVYAQDINFNRRTVIQLFSLGDTPGRREIRIQVPANQLNSVNITNTSGRVDINGMNTEVLYIRATSGNVHINNVTAETLETRATSGNIRVNNITAETLSVTATSGNIHVNNATAETLSAIATSGNVRGENVHFSDGMLRSTSGNVNIENISWSELEATTTSGNVRISDARIHVEEELSTVMRTTSGTVRLEISNRSDEINYETTSNTGTVRVEGGGQRFRNSGRGVIGTSGGIGGHSINMSSRSGNVRLEFGS